MPQTAPLPPTWTCPGRIEADLDLDAPGHEGVVLRVTAHGRAAAQLARRASDGHPAALIQLREAREVRRAAPAGPGVFLAGRPLHVHGAASEAGFVDALRAAWSVPASWFGGYVGAGVEDLARLLALGRGVHAAHAPGDLVAASQALAGRLEGVLRRSPAVAVALLGPPGTRLGALGPALGPIVEAAPDASVVVSLTDGLPRPFVALWAAEP